MSVIAFLVFLLAEFHRTIPHSEARLGIFQTKKPFREVGEVFFLP